MDVCAEKLFSCGPSGEKTLRIRGIRVWNYGHMFLAFIHEFLRREKATFTQSLLSSLFAKIRIKYTGECKSEMSEKGGWKRGALHGCFGGFGGLR